MDVGEWGGGAPVIGAHLGNPPFSNLSDGWQSSPWQLVLLSVLPAAP